MATGIKKGSGRPLIYLASPHSHIDPEIRTHRYHQAVDAAALLIGRGHMIFCPIAHSHPIHVSMMQRGAPDPDWAFYEEFDTRILSICDELWVLELEGWKKSRGVNAEIAFARRMDMRVVFLNPAKLHL